MVGHGLRLKEGAGKTTWAVGYVVSLMSPSGRPELKVSCIDHMHTHIYTRSYKNEAPDDASAGLQTAPTGKSHILVCMIHSGMRDLQNVH